MKCPTDGSILTMSERHGIEIDYCPSCRGVWLDRGELDKILDRAAAQVPGSVVTSSAPAPRMQYSRDPSYGGHAGGQAHRRKRKESWLSELFD
jgi:uncharacterized protein